jgi:hypothetical protein
MRLKGRKSRSLWLKGKMRMLVKGEPLRFKHAHVYLVGITHRAMEFENWFVTNTMFKDPENRVSGRMELA